jgi:seryl-tRNA synthetase
MSVHDVHYDMASFHDGLVAHGLILPSGVPGVFGRGAAFERVVAGLNHVIDELAKDDGADHIQHPPVLSRKVLEQVNYLESFPHLCGSIHSFMGNGMAALKLAGMAQAGEPWGEMLAPSDLVMSPAACYSVYPSMAGTLPEGGRLIGVNNWVYRHEPSDEPTRMMSFRMREYIRLAGVGEVLPWRELWLQRLTGLLEVLHLPARAEVASDPFFGRGGKMLAASQIEQKLKFELMVPVNSLEAPTALMSFNYHQTKFAEAFGIRQAHGELAHTACVGVGMERLTMALFKHLGFDTRQWPLDVRQRLWPLEGR